MISRKEKRRTVALDFDGVVHQHVSPWTVAHEIHDGPVPGAFEFIERALEEFDVVIFSARANDQRARGVMFEWLVRHWVASGRHSRAIATINITAEKPHAFIYIDDRGWRFEGTFPTMDWLRTFEPWTKKPKLEGRQRIDELWAKRQALHRELDAVIGEENALWLEESRKDHQCSCVRLNKDIEVFDMGDVEKRKRRTFGIGPVAELISADEDCALCGGSGKPVEGAPV